MSIPPEVSFDRFFRGLSASRRTVYKGKFDLDRLESSEFRQLLLKIQNGMIYALNNEKQVPEHKDHPPFHVDYIDSSDVNALAFRHEGYSFIGLTIPLIDTIFETCTRLSTFEAIAAILGVQLAGEESYVL